MAGVAGSARKRRYQRRSSAGDAGSPLLSLSSPAPLQGGLPQPHPHPQSLSGLALFQGDHSSSPLQGRSSLQRGESLQIGLPQAHQGGALQTEGSCRPASQDAGGHSTPEDSPGEPPSTQAAPSTGGGAPAAAAVRGEIHDNSSGGSSADTHGASESRDTNRENSGWVLSPAVSPSDGESTCMRFDEPLQFCAAENVCREH